LNKKTVALHNLGCKVNAYETEAAADAFRNSGYEIVPFAPGADIYIINTCSVTNIADKKSRQMIHKAKKMNPEAIIVAMGCYVQSGKSKEAEEALADVIIGNNRKKDVVRIVREYERERRHIRDVEDLSKCREYETVPVSGVIGHARGFMKVQDGCDMFCSYCIIPYVRGRVRSRSLKDAVKEAELLAEKGCREIVLSGIHLSSYGKDFGGGTGLTDLIAGIHEVEGIKRIRLGSLEPGIITEDFAKTLADFPKLCPHFHLSLQSGCDKILKAMNRRYDTAQYREKCAILRRFFDEPSITTDIITGFPTETEEDFEETYAFADSMDFFETHVFPYSVREGTKAAAMPGQLTEAVKKERASRLIALSDAKLKLHLERLEGQVKEVLFEEERSVDGEMFWFGHTREYEKAAVKSSESLKNALVKVKIKGMFDNSCVLGEIACNI
jgi:threonylcarbamoyladenosine tRNA methylthiotransferase MtaB